MTLPTVAAAELGADGASLVVAVENAGERPSSMVVFAFAGVEGSAFERPRRRLVGFVRGDAGSGDRVEFVIDVDWSMLDVRVDGSWVTESGEYLLDVGRYAGDPDAVTISVHR